MSNESEVVTTPASHTADAQARVDELRAMRQKIPHFVFPSSKRDQQRLISAASVPQEFTELTAMTVRNSAALVRGDGSDPDQTRELLSFADAYAPFADELEAMAHFVRHSITVAKHKAGSNALNTYEMAKRLAKRPETADLAPHVADMRRALGRGRKAKAKPAPAAPSPVTIPSPATKPE